MLIQQALQGRAPLKHLKSGPPATSSTTSHSNYNTRPTPPLDRSVAGAPHGNQGETPPHQFQWMANYRHQFGSIYLVNLLMTLDFLSPAFPSDPRIWHSTWHRDVLDIGLCDQRIFR